MATKVKLDPAAAGLDAGEAGGSKTVYYALGAIALGLIAWVFWGTENNDKK